MKYIIEGRAIGNVLRENRIRIAKGDLIVTPLAEAVTDEKGAEVADTKEAEVVDTKEAEVADTKEVTFEDETKPAKKSKK